ncbi:MFS transporter [Pinibacter aurantiacus]|uniref:MFS transporter n=1 Tax=Pinibacter aurantiacus TaxID=2851599 RepID=A0A9E2W9D6_9BACT|nr:MFS transporter [Pinibacter aurantiacus]MBV4359522.1 MFS transporter [Pinibacter aurantiacus]
MESQQQKPSPFEVLSVKEFRFYIVQRFFYTMALRMVTTVVGWHMYQLTKSPFALGLIGLSEVIPAVGLALYAGHYIDKNDKRTVLLRCIVSYLSLACCLVFLSTGFSEQHIHKNIILSLFYVIIFFTGVVRAFAGPTSNAIVAQIVPREKLPGAITMGQSTYLTASILGHASAGFLIAYVGSAITLSVVCLYAAIAATAVALIKRKPIVSLDVNKRTWESVKEGLRYVFKTKELLGAMSLDLFAVLFGGAVALIPVFASDILKVGPIGFGWLNAATDIGSVASILTMTIFPLRGKQGKILLFAVAGFGLCIITFGLSQVFWLSFAALLVSGTLDGISVVVRGTILQLKTPDELRGRVSSVSSMFISSSNELGLFESGVAAKLLGVVPSVIFGGCMTLGVVIFTWFKAPSLRKMEY